MDLFLLIFVFFINPEQNINQNSQIFYLYLSSFQCKVVLRSSGQIDYQVFNKLYLIMNIPQAQRSSSYRQSDQNRVIDLQKKLMEAWQSHNVDDYYQQIILNFLDKISPDQVEYEITKEIKAMHSGQSLYFKLSNRLNSRQRAINSLQKLVNQGKYQNKNQLIPTICEEIKRLRDSNLECAETIIQLHRQYGQKSENLSAQQQQILMNLDQQNAFLKQSYIKNYIFFQNGYDPFFLYHYDLRGKRRPQTAHLDVDKLFNLTVSYACRLFKTKKQLLNIISSGKTNERYSYESPRKEEPRRPHKLIGISQKLSNKYEGINSQRIKDNQTRKTSINFRGKPLSLQAAIQKDLLKNGISPKDYRQSPNFRKRKLHTIAPENLDRSYLKYEQRLNQMETPERRHSTNIGQGDDEQSVKPRRQLLNAIPIFIPHESQNLYKLVVQNMSSNRIKKKMSIADEDQTQQLAQSRNWKVRLQPVIQNTAKNTLQKDKRFSASPEQRIKSMSPKKQELSNENQSYHQQIRLTNASLKKKKPSLQDQSKQVEKGRQKKKKQIKMRTGKYSFNQLMKYLKGLKIKEELKTNTILSNKWEQSLAKCQSYFCQFLESGQLLAIAICLKMTEGPYLIKLWATLQDCDLQTSKILFQKYIQYIQKNTNQDQILFNGDQIQEFKSCNFVKKRQRLFSRKRVFKSVKKQSEFQLFLSLKCSNIVFSQQNTKTNILFSEQIQCFSKETTFVCPQIGLIKKRQLRSELLMLVKINQQLKNMKTLNGLLQDQNFDTYQQDSKLKISNINALRFSINTPFKSSFIAGDGFIRLTGLELVKNQKQVLFKVSCIKNNIFIYFGKGFSNCSKFIQGTKKETTKICEFNVKMFNKELYGRLPIQSDLGCYGNWQISFWWQDELQGRIRHPMGTVQSLGPDPFFTGIQIEGHLVYVFNVKKDDFLL